jgi:hypothetical protein
MSQIVQSRAPSGEGLIYKKTMAIDFGSIPSPFVKEVTGAFEEADANDLVVVSPQAATAGIFFPAARVSATGVVAITIGTTGGATLTPNTLTLDVYVTKGDASV